MDLFGIYFAFSLFLKLVKPRIFTILSAHDHRYYVTLMYLLLVSLNAHFTILATYL